MQLLDLVSSVGPLSSSAASAWILEPVTTLLALENSGGLGQRSAYAFESRRVLISITIITQHRTAVTKSRSPEPLLENCVRSATNAIGIVLQQSRIIASSFQNCVVSLKHKQLHVNSTSNKTFPIALSLRSLKYTDQMSISSQIALSGAANESASPTLLFAIDSTRWRKHLLCRYGR